MSAVRRRVWPIVPSALVAMSCACGTGATAEADGGRDPQDATSIQAEASAPEAAAVADGPVAFCTWPNFFDAGTVFCPADDKTQCSSGYNGDICTCVIGEGGVPEQGSCSDGPDQNCSFLNAACDTTRAVPCCVGTCVTDGGALGICR